MPPSTPGAMTGQHDSRRPPIKRVAEQAVEDLEKEMAVDASDMDVAMSGLVWQDNLSLGCCCLSITECVTNGDLVDMSVDSLRYASGGQSAAVKAKLCGKMVLLRAPDDAICDSTGQVLDGKLTLKGMVEEIESMSSCWVGEPISLARVEKIKQEHPNTRVILTRWVTAFKSFEQACVSGVDHVWTCRVA